MVAQQGKTAAAVAPATSVLAGLSEAEVRRLVAKGQEAEEKEKAKSMGKQEKAKMARAGKAILLREAKDARKKAGLPLSPSIVECKAWIAAHPPTPAKPKTKV